MNFLDENGLLRLWTHISSKFEKIIKKEDIATEVTETEENPVSGAAIHTFVTESIGEFLDENNNLTIGKNIYFPAGRISYSPYIEGLEMFIGSRGLRLYGVTEKENDAEGLLLYSDRGGGQVSTYNVYHEGNLIYSETEPENPVEGMIWLVPPSSDS